MRTFSVFLKKEWMELVRTGRLLILGIIFVLFGIMNPAIAKLTPWLMEAMSDSLKSTGLTVGTVTVDAMVSWMQFYKNIPMALLIFVLMWSQSFSQEQQKGTWIMAVTKGFARWKIVVAKGTVMLVSWTVCYWLCFGITYGYNAYFWDNGTVQNCLFAAVCYWGFGLWAVGLLVLFSAAAATGTAALLGTGGSLAAFYFLSFFQKEKDILPVALMQSGELLSGAGKIEEYFIPLFAAVCSIVICLLLAVLIFRKRKI